ncbi:PDC sensor domain-containing protein [Candidatus Peregrinibacteria bacterium]|nr:PDC sensor domain-containing protein [Candidatus Peregrinibacteria bacterium]
MTSLPASIEAYLLEAGFSPTEITILKRLLEGEALTLRELGAKTGKSTGVLDQATKKLLAKKILNRDIINGVPKFTVTSLPSIAAWVEQDMREKRDTLQRKHKDFEAFLSTLELDKGRPEMEYFEGEEGIQQAFSKLLEYDDLWLCYTQATCKEEDDPLCEFKVQLFRKRRNAKIFARVIAPDTFLGRRFASRDAFEYRETKLVPEDRMPVGFEKIIAGDTVACFNHTEKRACFIRYRELADTQRKLFEMLWCMGTSKSEEECAVVPAQSKPAVVSLETKTLSGLREFFPSRKSLITMGSLAVIAGLITFGMYRQNLYLNTQRIRDQVRAIAATGASTFSARDVQKVHTPEDMNTPEYKRIVGELANILHQNPELKYVYMIRPTGREDMYEFVADSYGLRTDEDIDFNGDGIIGEEDEIPIPGTPYDISERPDATIGIVEPYADAEPFSDQWGTFISGFAPVKDAGGKAVAVLGIDREATDLKQLSNESFKPFGLFFVLFVIFLLVRLAAFNRSLCKEIILTLRQQSTLFVLCLTLGLASIVTYGLYMHTSTLNLVASTPFLRHIARNEESCRFVA